MKHPSFITNIFQLFTSLQYRCSSTKSPPSCIGHLQMHPCYWFSSRVTCANSHWWPHLYPMGDCALLFPECHTQKHRDKCNKFLQECRWHKLCLKSRGGQRAATRMHFSEFTHHITEIMAAEEYTHTIVTQAYTLSLKHTWGRMNNIPTPLSHIVYLSPLLSLFHCFST